MARRPLQLAGLAGRAGLVGLALLLGAGAAGCAGCADDAAPPPTCLELSQAWQARVDELSTLCTFDDDWVVVGQPGSCDCSRQRSGSSGCGIGVRKGAEVDARLLELEAAMARCTGPGAAVICDCARMVGRCVLARCRAEFAARCSGDAGP